jgi:hypothetical protein
MTDRIQLSRAKGWRMPPNTIVVTRGPGKPYGNPFKASDHGKGEHAQAIAVKLYECWLAEPAQSQLVGLIKRDLRGKNLACFCKMGTPCHADVLLEIANGELS